MQSLKGRKHVHHSLVYTHTRLITTSASVLEYRLSSGFYSWDGIEKQQAHLKPLMFTFSILMLNFKILAVDINQSPRNHNSGYASVPKITLAQFSPSWRIKNIVLSYYWNHNEKKKNVENKNKQCNETVYLKDYITTYRRQHRETTYTYCLLKRVQSELKPHTRQTSSDPWSLWIAPEPVRVFRLLQIWRI